MEAFSKPKLTMLSSPVLAMVDFSKPLVIETNASGVGIGTVLLPDKWARAYICKALSSSKQGMSTYEK